MVGPDPTLLGQRSGDAFGWIQTAVAFGNAPIEDHADSLENATRCLGSLHPPRSESSQDVSAGDRIDPHVADRWEHVRERRQPLLAMLHVLERRCLRRMDRFRSLLEGWKYSPCQPSFSERVAARTRNLSQPRRFFARL